MKATEQYFPVVLSNLVVLTFQSLDEILKCDHSKAVLSCGAVYYTVQGGYTFETMNEILKCDHMKA